MKYGRRPWQPARTPKRKYGPVHEHRLAFAAFVELALRLSTAYPMSIKNVAGILKTSRGAIIKWDLHDGRIGSNNLRRMYRLIQWTRDGLVNLHEIREINWDEGRFERWDHERMQYPLRAPGSGAFAGTMYGTSRDNIFPQFISDLRISPIQGGHLLGMTGRDLNRVYDFDNGWRKTDAIYLVRMICALYLDLRSKERYRAAYARGDEQASYQRMASIHWDRGLIFYEDGSVYHEPLIKPPWLDRHKGSSRLIRKPKASKASGKIGEILQELDTISASRAGTWKFRKFDAAIRRGRDAFLADPHKDRILKPYTPSWKLDLQIRHAMTRRLSDVNRDLMRELDVYRNRIKSRNQERNQDSARQKGD